MSHSLNTATCYHKVPSIERLLTIMDYEEGSFQDYPMHSDTIDRVKFSDNDSELLYSVCSSGIYLWTVLSPADSV